MRRNLELKYGNKFGNNKNNPSKEDIRKLKKQLIEEKHPARVKEYYVKYEDITRKLKKAERRANKYAEYDCFGNCNRFLNRVASNFFFSSSYISILSIEEKIKLFHWKNIDDFIKETQSYNNYLILVYDEEHIKAIDDIKARWKHRCFVRKMQKELNDKTITKSERKGKL